MDELLSLLPPLALVPWLMLLALVAGLPLVTGLTPRHPPMPVQSRTFRAMPSYRRSYLVVLACSLLLMLSACGTAPSRVITCPPVPAQLLEPPQEPVLLPVAPPSKTPGATTSRTLSAAAKTGLGIGR